MKRLEEVASLICDERVFDVNGKTASLHIYDIREDVGNILIPPVARCRNKPVVIETSGLSEYFSLLTFNGRVIDFELLRKNQVDAHLFEFRADRERVLDKIKWNLELAHEAEQKRLEEMAFDIVDVKLYESRTLPQL